MKSKSSKMEILLLTLITSTLVVNSYADTTGNATTSFLDATRNYLMSLHVREEPDFGASLGLSAPLVISGVLCFTAAVISSAGGVGGGGLFVPILTITAGLDLKTASSFSAFMVTGASIANVASGLAGTGGGKGSLIDFDIALLSQPSMMLGVSAGVICNVMFPEWLITALFAVFLAWSTSKTLQKGVVCWALETRGLHLRKTELCGAAGGDIDRLENGNGLQESLLLRKEQERRCTLGLPWMKIWVLVLIWFSFSLLYLLRGNRYGEGLFPIQPCGVAYWMLSSAQIPLAIAYTAWILCRKDSPQSQNSSQKELLDEMAQVGQTSKFMFPFMALLAGGLGGVFGIGGGMLISPLLLHVGIGPEVTSATCSFMVFFSSTMSAFQYLLLGMEHVDVALVLSAACFVASLIGLVVVQRAVRQYGRASLIILSVGLVMALSTLLMTSYGVVDVLRDLSAGKYMGFKLPC